MSFSTIRKYLGYVHPTLLTWSKHVSSLREITPDHVRDVFKGLRGNSAKSLQSGLRSLVRALKQERLVFRDPARGISLRKVQLLPRPLPSDRVTGLLDKATDPLARFMVVLVAIHALANTELAALQLVDLHLARGRLIHRRSGVHHTLYLDELTHNLAVSWLRERQRRWPLAVDHQPPPATQPANRRRRHRSAYQHARGRAVLRTAGDHPVEAPPRPASRRGRHTEDPVHLMRVSGISDTTAMKYLYTAHPERRSKPPR